MGQSMLSGVPPLISNRIREGMNSGGFMGGGMPTGMSPPTMGSPMGGNKPMYQPIAKPQISPHDPRVSGSEGLVNRASMNRDPSSMQGTRMGMPMRNQGGLVSGQPSSMRKRGQNYG